MASNVFGNIFKVMTWGESHGTAVGVVIDGCPAGLALSNNEINTALSLRAPGRSEYISPRKEADAAEIYSGIFEGVTTGAPISIIIQNKDVDSSKYEPTKHLLRPGHANYTYTEKYGVFDYRGSGRASARETACRVAAGVVAQKILDQVGIEVLSYIQSIGSVECNSNERESPICSENIRKSSIFCPDKLAEKKILQSILAAKAEGDSLGGIVAFVVNKMPAGLGDPIYEKLEANLAKAMLSLPATKGFEIGEGFIAAKMTGSEHNDRFIAKDGNPTETNHAGGTLGGISTGMPLRGRVAFKPTSSIQKSQETVNYDGQQETFELPAGSRHDPCVAIRAVPVVQAMCQLVIADAMLINRCVRV